jgi:hypothetical protein
LDELFLGKQWSKRLHKPKFPPTSLTKNWYPRPTSSDIQFEERNFQSQFAVFADKLYGWNIDGLSEYQILDKLTHMTMVLLFLVQHSFEHKKLSMTKETCFYELCLCAIDLLFRFGRIS